MFRSGCMVPKISILEETNSILKMGKALDNTGYKGYLKPKRIGGRVSVQKTASEVMSPK